MLLALAGESKANPERAGTRRSPLPYKIQAQINQQIRELTPREQAFISHNTERQIFLTEGTSPRLRAPPAFPGAAPRASLATLFALAPKPKRPTGIPVRRCLATREARAMRTRDLSHDHLATDAGIRGSDLSRSIVTATAAGEVTDRVAGPRRSRGRGSCRV